MADNTPPTTLTPEQTKQLNQLPVGLLNLGYGNPGIGQVPPGANPQTTIGQLTAQQLSDIQNTGKGKGAGASGANPQVQGEISGLTYGQEMNPNWMLVGELSSQLAGMSPTDAQAILKQIPAGSELSKYLNEALSGKSLSDIYHPAATTGGFDPLSIANFSSSVVAPFLKGQESNADTGINSLMALAQKDLPKSMQGDLATLGAAVENENKTGAEAAVQAPQFDSLINALTQAVQQYKTAQGVYQLAPYYTQMIQTGQVPSVPGVGPTGLLPPPTLTPTNG